MRYHITVPARINVLGNPSDANEGDFATISAAVNVYAGALVEPAEGIVRGVGIKPLPGLASYPIEIELDNEEEKLFPGMVVEGRIVSEIYRNVIYTSFNNIIVEYDNNFVYIVNGENKAERRNVKLGDKVGELVIITEGLNEGDKLVLMPFVGGG